MNKSRLRSKGSERQFKALYEAIAVIENAQEAEQFFKDLCTPAELQAMSDRWQVVVPIVEGTPYRDIYEATQVSVTTVGRVARTLSFGLGGYELILKRLNKRKKERSDEKK